VSYRAKSTPSFRAKGLMIHGASAWAAAPRGAQGASTSSTAMVLVVLGGRRNGEGEHMEMERAEINVSILDVPFRPLRIRSSG
jgi:hypothetical protein